MIRPVDTWDDEGTRASFHDGTFENWILGRKVQKHRDDLRRLIMGIGIAKPDLVIETGTRWGGSAGWFAEIGKCGVISIDIAPQVGWTARNYDQAHRGITYIEGSSIDPDVVTRVSKLTHGKRVMVVLDSDHHSDHVAYEIDAYGPMVSRGSFLVVEDGCFDMWEGEDSRRGGRSIPEVGGPLKAINEKLVGQPAWARFIEIEHAYRISHSPCGWWQRVHDQ